MLFWQNGTLNIYIKQKILSVVCWWCGSTLLFFILSKFCWWSERIIFYFYFHVLFKRASESEDQGINWVWPYYRFRFTETFLYGVGSEFIPVDGSALTLNIFQEADWMKNISQEPIFDKTKDGVFIARHTGIYLLYAHVSFLANQSVWARLCLFVDLRESIPKILAPPDQ